MTREEAINVLNDYDINFERNTAEEVAEAHEMAIKALKPQQGERTKERTETHACDCISRQFMYDMGATCIAARNKDGDLVALGALDILPSATPQPKTGYWEWVQYESKPNFGNWHCSECRCILYGEIKENPIRLPKYCPECGAKMQEAKE